MVSSGQPAPAGPRIVTYVNDPINRLGMTEDNNGTITNTTYAPNGLNQYTAVSSQQQPPVYDEKFNLSDYDGWHYVYDADNRLISAAGATNGVSHTASFIYDGLGRCVKRTIDNQTTRFTFDEWKPIVEWTDSGGFVAWNLYGPGADEILVRFQPNVGGYVHYHLDAMGNVQFLLSGDNLGLEKYTYDAFGQPQITSWNGSTVRSISAHGNRFMFTGREYIYTLGLYDYRHRIYHPGLGRFIQTDPLGLQIEGAKLSAQQTALYSAGTAPATFNSSELNLYRYCHNDPINKSDPTGLMSLTGWGGGDWKWFNGGVALAQLNAISLQKMAASMRFVPTNFAKDHKTVLPSSTDHSGGIYEYQYSNSAGQRQSGVGVTVLEKVKTVAGDEVGQVQKQEAPLQSNGIFRDHVGSNRRPSHADDGHYSISHQTFQIERNGETVPVSTKLGHDVRFINGEVVPRVWVIEP
jgi:RHS repeat-associated protein